MEKLKAALYSPPVLLSFLFLVAILWGKSIPYDFARGFYTFSIFLKDCLMLFLPVAIMIYISTALKDFKKNTAFVILIIILFEAISNTSSVWFAYFAVKLSSFDFVLLPPSSLKDLETFFSISFLKPNFWSPDKGVILGSILGVLLSYKSLPKLLRLLEHGLFIVNFVLKNIFAKSVPLFAFGFLLNLSHSGLLEDISSGFSYVFCMLSLAMTLYLAILFLVGAGFNFSLSWEHFINTLPSGIIAFTSMSSAATMPYTIQGAEKNLKRPVLARMIIPATTNIQQVGDCLINSFMCLVILLSFGRPMPSFYDWGLFTGAFIIARYATTAVAGGAIFVMLPIYEAYLGFTPQEISIILALNVILDPFVTASNVLGNGALAIILEKILLKLGVMSKNDPLSSN